MQSNTISKGAAISSVILLKMQQLHRRVQKTLQRYAVLVCNNYFRVLCNTEKQLGSPGLRVARCYIMLSQDDSSNKNIALIIIFVKWIIVKCKTDVFKCIYR